MTDSNDNRGYRDNRDYSHDRNSANDRDHRDDQNESIGDRSLLGALGSLPNIEPPADLHDRFRARVQASRAPLPFRVPTRRPWVTVALAASLVLAIGTGWWLDRQRREAEVGRLRAELTLALKDLSAAKRMQAIATAGRTSAHDGMIAGVLADALLHDPNTNVRLAAAQALATVGTGKTFSSAAAAAFASERSPFVQAALLDAARRLSADERASLVRILLARPDLDVDLRARASRPSSL